jgi:hypothetical protein
MKIEIHVYHHFLNCEPDPALVRALTEKLRASNERLSEVVANTAPAQEDSSSSTQKETRNVDPTT